MQGSGTVTKAVILARGLGTRMRSEAAGAVLNQQQSELAAAGVKAMIPVGRPFLDYVLSSLADAGFKQVCLVIGPEHGMIREYYSRVEATRIEINFVVQVEPLGTADAILPTEEFVAQDEFLTINADNYYPADALFAIQKLGRPGAVLFPADILVRNGNIAPERIREFARVVVDEQGLIRLVEEKAGADPDGENLVSMNIWRFSRSIFPLCRDVPISARGELELPGAVNLGIARGVKMKAAICHRGVLDLSRRSDIPAVTERLKGVQVNL